MEYIYPNELQHHGILGQKWGVRRYQNKDGTLTRAGRKRYLKRNSDTLSYNIVNDFANTDTYKGLKSDYKKLDEMLKSYRADSMESTIPIVYLQERILANQNATYDYVEKYYGKYSGYSFDEIKNELINGIKPSELDEKMYNFWATMDPPRDMYDKNGYPVPYAEIRKKYKSLKLPNTI